MSGPQVSCTCQASEIKSCVFDAIQTKMTYFYVSELAASCHHSPSVSISVLRWAWWLYKLLSLCLS